MNKHRWTGAMAGVILLLVAGCSETGRIADGADGIHLSGPGPGNGTPGAQDATEDDSWEQDASPRSDAAPSPDGQSTVPPEFVECQANEECDSGYCVPGPDGKVCTTLCVDECPDGWLCKELDSLVNPDSICVYPHLTLCRPCVFDNDCVQALWGASNHCISHGDEGSFCGVECNALSPCPGGYLCQPVTTSGGSVVNQCMPLEGECQCTESFIKAGAKTTCSVANPIGTCFGERVCKAGGLTACDAVTPQPESCNGQDDNCNGLVDDGDICTGGQQCVAGNCVTDCQPVDGGWTEWSCSPCPVQCGLGNKSCTRTCTNPTPACGGNVCVGQSSKTESCSANCPQGQQCINGACVADLCKPDPCNGRGWCIHNTGACICDPGYTGAKCTECLSPWAWVPADAICRPTNIIGGTEADEVITGTAGDDTIQGLDGDDQILGMEGSDLINGNMGADVVNGNMGRDEVRGGAGADQVHGGAESDFLMGGGGNDTLVGGGGNDRMMGGGEDDLIQGMDGNDYYMIDGMGHDTFDDSAGLDAARCMDGVTAVSDFMNGPDRVLILNTEGSVTILNNSVENVYGCE
jgi:hypothetical protein